MQIPVKKKKKKEKKERGILKKRYACPGLSVIY